MIEMEENHQTLPEKHYERGMNHNYMILSTYDFFGQEEEEDYTTRMLLGNKIPGLIPMMCRNNMGEKQYCYEINSLQSLDRLYEKQEIGYEALYKLLMGCIRVLERLEEYLLDGTQVVLNPEYIYVHMETGEPFFVCYPEYHSDIRYSFMDFMDYLLTKIDHTQEQAVWLGYQVYRYTRNPNYILSEVKELLYKSQERILDEKSEVDDDKADIWEKEKVDHYVRSRGTEDVEPCSYRIEEEILDDDVKDMDEEDTKVAKKSSWRKNIWGGMLCVLLACSAAGIIFGSKLLNLIPLSQKQEISLYGAIGMSITAAVIFFASLVKHWKQEMQIEELAVEEENEVSYWEQDIEAPYREESNRVSEKKRTALEERQCMGQTVGLAGATVLLNQEYEQEHFLNGNINGKEVRVPLKHFPFTIGKLAGFSDFVVHDNTVSRMHARLEQRDGKVYISDLNSTNGTVRNGDLLAMNEEVALEPGDKLMLGRACFTYF